MKIKKNWGLLILLGYLAGIYHGRIALWHGEDPEPDTVFPYEASLLPPADQAALEKGIPIHSGSELIRFIEDFCS